MKKIFLLIIIILSSALSTNCVFASNSIKQENCSKTAQTQITNPEYDWNKYVKNVQAKVKKHWYPPKSTDNYKTIVKFTVDREGKAHSVKVISSSNEKSYDEAAKKAVIAASPFEKLPDFVKDSGINIQLTLEYNPLLGPNKPPVTKANQEKLYAEKYFKLALEKHTKGNYEDAIDYYSNAIILNPKNHELYLYRGCAYADNKKHLKAIKDFSTAIKHNPKNPNFYVKRGSSYIELKEYKKALSDYKKAIELAPKEPAVFENRANLYFLIDDYKNAIPDYTKAIELTHKNKDLEDLYYFRAATYKNLKQYDNAISDLKKVIKINSQNADYYFMISAIYEIQEDYKKAFYYHQKAKKYCKKNNIK